MGWVLRAFCRAAAAHTRDAVRHTTRHPVHTQSPRPPMSPPPSSSTRRLGRGQPHLLTVCTPLRRASSAGPRPDRAQIKPRSSSDRAQTELRSSSDHHEHDEEDELAHAAAQVVRGEKRLEEAACHGGGKGALGTGSCVSVRQTTTLVVRGLGRAFLCLSVCLSVCLSGITAFDRAGRRASRALLASRARRGSTMASSSSPAGRSAPRATSISEH